MIETWINFFVKSEIIWKNRHYNTYAKNSYKGNDHFQLQEAAKAVSQVVSNRRQEFSNNIALKLNNSKTIATTYWSILKTFYNDNKILVIPPFLTENKFVSIFKTKAKHFSIFLLATIPH